MAALFALLLGASGLLLGYFLYDFGEQSFLEETEAAIDSEMQRVLVELEGKPQDQMVLMVKYISARAANPIYFYTSVDGVLLAGNVDRLPDDIGRLKEGVIQFEVMMDHSARSIAAKIHTFEDGSRLLIGRDIQRILERYDTLTLFTILIISFMCVVVLVSFLISTFVVARINLIAQTAKDIMDTGDLSRRISIEGDWDDLSNLAQVLNRLLEQVESLMQGVRDVSNNIAHDLRTPLTRLRNQLEDGSKQGLDKEQVRELLGEADMLLSVFGSLLRIARIEKSGTRESFSDVDLGVILDDVVELYEPVAEEREIAISKQIDTQQTIKGDRDLLFQLFANLLDNAIKYSHDQGEVDISLHHDGGKTTVCIADKGVGISEEERERVFERFYRSDKSRATEGCGLGLSLVKAIIDMHDAHITLEDNAPGLRVVIGF